MVTRAIINLEGIVQGVGFRPFVHRLNKRFKLSGFVANTTRGVEIDVEGKKKNIQNFYQNLQKELPPLAKITNRHITFAGPKGYKNFVIGESKKTYPQTVLVSPDISICNDCLKELFGPLDRRYLYPFINCTNCGPRFTIIQGLPYDRPLTTMQKFKMCGSCKAEYEDINNRRYHAQPNACSMCGPEIELVTKSPGHQVTSIAKGIQALKETIGLLKTGKIIAVKGLGGFHIACDADNTAAIKKLRLRKNRPFKPFAIMLSDMKEITKICHASKLERDILTSPERPIVLLKKKKSSKVNEALAPRNNYLGIMLAHTPLHYLLFFPGLAEGQSIKSLVMTSGNIADEPIEIENNAATNNLKGICDYFLIHNRDIYNRMDDSIVCVMDNKPVVLRRGRGYSPMPFLVHKKMKNILSVGAELKSTFCITKNKFAFLSQYIGDLKTYATFSSYKQAISRFLNLFAVKPKIIARDLHPDYLSTKYSAELGAENKGVRLTGVQHHQAHIASVIAEHRIKENVIGVSLDGIGYGIDGNIWGGEFFIGNLKKFKRAAQLEYVPMPGQDKATQEPYRMAISYLYMAYKDKLYKLKIGFIKRHKPVIYNIISLIRKPSPLTSSAGRLFDAVSALLGICDIITYEAQAAIELQMCAEKSQTKRAYSFKIKETAGLFIIKPQGVIREIVRDLKKGAPKEEIARKFHNGLVKIIERLCALLRKQTHIATVALSGGVFQNKLLLENLVKRLKQSGFKVYYNELLPTNDGAISLGQAVIANET